MKKNSKEKPVSATKLYSSRANLGGPAAKSREEAHKAGGEFSQEPLKGKKY